MPFNSTNSEVFLVEVNPPFERVEFQFMPQGLKYTRTANIKNAAIVGRNNDLYYYTGGRDSLTFTVDFFADEEEREDVMRKLNFLRSLPMSNGGNGPARNVKLVMGKFMRKEIWIVSNVEISPENLDNRFGYMPLRGSATITLILDPNKNRSINDVRNQ